MRVCHRLYSKQFLEGTANTDWTFDVQFIRDSVTIRISYVSLKLVDQHERQRYGTLALNSLLWRRDVQAGMQSSSRGNSPLYKPYSYVRRQRLQF